MTRTRILVVIGTLGLVLSVLLLARIPVGGAQAQAPPAKAPGTAGHTHKPGSPQHDHDHPPVPAAYANTQIPTNVWTDPKMLAKGKEIFTAKCALCHGEKGDGKGPGSVNLPLKPADLTDAKMVAEMPGNFWVWRVSEGGLVEPFRSKGSTMPAWKGELSMQDRWAVIAYAHTLSGHRGPHDASQHPELKPKPKFVTGEGTVVALRPDKQQIVVEHGEIKHFMEAMTMGYKIAPLSLLERVKPGDKVRFTIDTDARAITKIDRVAD
ncbi:MAG: copper-binding protein [Candidatus Rokuibacteriota bacterium]